MLGSSSSYDIHRHFKKQKQGPDVKEKSDRHPMISMAYNNINRRILALHKKGFLEEIERHDKTNIHGRKDYRVSLKGLQYLIPDILSDAGLMEDLVQYADVSGLDSKNLAQLLLKELANMVVKIDGIYGLLISTNQYQYLPEVKHRLNHIISLQENLERKFSEGGIHVDGKRFVEKVHETQQSNKLNKIVERTVKNLKSHQPMTTKETQTKKIKKKPT